MSRPHGIPAVVIALLVLMILALISAMALVPLWLLSLIPESGVVIKEFFPQGLLYLYAAGIPGFLLAAGLEIGAKLLFAAGFIVPKLKHPEKIQALEANPHKKLFTALDVVVTLFSALPVGWLVAQISTHFELVEVTLAGGALWVLLATGLLYLGTGVEKLVENSAWYKATANSQDSSQ